MPKVTESLRRTWAAERAQMIEEREFTQSGRARSDADIRVVNFDVKILDHLLSLPVGTKFDGQEIEKELRDNERHT